jgi:hypothetical protein
MKFSTGSRRVTLASWQEFTTSSPELAERALRLLARSGDWEGLLTTVSGTSLPRTHPVNIGVVDGRLFVFVQAGSAKARELATDGRYSLVNHQDPSSPHELLVRGRATLIEDHAMRRHAAEGWPFTPDDSYPLFELDIETALLGERDSPDEWPPRYQSWAASG